MHTLVLQGVETICNDDAVRDIYFDTWLWVLTIIHSWKCLHFNFCQLRQEFALGCVWHTFALSRLLWLAVHHVIHALSEFHVLFQSICGYRAFPGVMAGAMI
jgi:hypothetical protein